MDDLQSFAVAVTKAGIVCLTMWGQAIKGQTLDYFNRYRRFNPIVGLMSNARIQALHLVSFSDFFTRISSSHIQMASQLRVITMRSTPLEDDVSMGVLTQILENSPNLTELWLDTDNPDKAYQMILSKICILPKLKSLGLQFRTKGVAVELLMWSIKTMNASFVSITASSPPHLTFVQRGVLTHLLIKNRIRISDDARLAKILHENPKLLEISLKCDSERFHAIIELVASTRERWRLEGYDLQRLRLELTQDYRQEREDEIKSTVQFSEHSVAYDMFTHVNLRSEWRPDPDYLPPLFRRYGWSIVTLDAGRGKLDDDLALQLDRSTEERTSNLAALALDPTRLSSNGAECIDRVLSRSNKLQDFSIYLRGPFTGNPAGTWLLGRHKEKLTSLDAKVAQADLDIPCLAEILPMRRDLPRLSSLTILSSGLNTQAHLAFPQECVPWLAAMVSAPGNPIIPTPPSSNLSEPPAALYSVTEADTSILWEPLRNVWLYVFSLQSEEWKTVIKALDFSTLETLGLRGTDFSTNELHVLVECIPEDGAAIPLMVLDFTSSALFESSGDSEVRSLCETLTSKAPRVTIKGLFNNPCGEV
ncbi:hypothetical protein BC939DRAFT_453973 [Gamsiella multidivaricata]|uniref:uncharacterized protein n=1 Tax=Gamsiella multidivaricata TaxID=101098 RepID=UPI00221F4E14|nr:uncharacterized protein BC939DRAFT_453973 [Gamsiella multidivaricata]KAI7822382.1 hypothetical protein BC939DRAFT_453973 [Gamsiella multidivaricata]